MPEGSVLPLELSVGLVVDEVSLDVPVELSVEGAAALDVSDEPVPEVSEDLEVSDDPVPLDSVPADLALG